MGSRIQTYVVEWMEDGQTFTDTWRSERRPTTSQVITLGGHRLKILAIEPPTETNIGKIRGEPFKSR
jgi:hypothetical protein